MQVLQSLATYTLQHITDRLTYFKKIKAEVESSRLLSYYLFK
jgi:hypothetical protein